MTIEATSIALAFMLGYIACAWRYAAGLRVALRDSRQPGAKLMVARRAR